MTEPARLNIRLTGGDDFEIVVKFPYPIAGYEFLAKIIDKTTTQTVAEFATTINEDKLYIRINSLEINDLEGDGYEWYLQQIDLTNFKTRIIEGDVKVKK